LVSVEHVFEVVVGASKVLVKLVLSNQTITSKVVSNLRAWKTDFADTLFGLLAERRQDGGEPDQLGKDLIDLLGEVVGVRLEVGGWGKNISCGLGKELKDGLSDQGHVWLADGSVEVSQVDRFLLGLLWFLLHDWGWRGAVASGTWLLNWAWFLLGAAAGRALVALFALGARFNLFAWLTSRILLLPDLSRNLLNIRFKLFSRVVNNLLSLLPDLLAFTNESLLLLLQVLIRELALEAWCRDDHLDDEHK
jgi:hypothetical protein